MRVGLVIVAAGSSRRMQGTEKIWAALSGQPVFLHAVYTLSPLVDTTVLVVRTEDLERVKQHTASLPFNVHVVKGGAHRHESVLFGVSALDKVEVIAVHDAARPFVSADLFERGLNALDEYAGVVPVVPLRDTIKLVDGGRVRATVNRTLLYAAQTPQLFKSGPLRAAQSVIAHDSVPTDEAVLMEEAGYRIGVFAGDPWNFKITDPFDLLLARAVAGIERS